MTGKKVLAGELKPGERFLHPLFKELGVVMLPSQKDIESDKVPVIYLADGQMDWIGKVVLVERAPLPC